MRRMREMDSMTKMLIVAALALAAVVVVGMSSLVRFSPSLSGDFTMNRIIGGVMVEGTVTNSGMGSAKNVSVFFTFYDHQGNVIREWTKVLGDMGPHSEREVQLRFRIDALDFTWQIMSTEP